MTHTPQKIAESQHVTDQIVDELLTPVKREMARLNWPPDLRAIMWKAVSQEAWNRHREAVREL